MPAQLNSPVTLLLYKREHNGVMALVHSYVFSPAVSSFRLLRTSRAAVLMNPILKYHAEVYKCGHKDKHDDDDDDADDGRKHHGSGHHGSHRGEHGAHGAKHKGKGKREHVQQQRQQQQQLSGRQDGAKVAAPVAGRPSGNYGSDSKSGCGNVTDKHQCDDANGCVGCAGVGAERAVNVWTRAVSHNPAAMPTTAAHHCCGLCCAYLLLPPPVMCMPAAPATSAAFEGVVNLTLAPPLA